MARARPPAARIGNRRIRLLLAFSLLVLLGVTLRAGYLQVVQGGRLEALASGQQRVERVLPATRGALLDRRRRALALSEPAVTLGAYTRLVDDADALARQLEPLVGIPRRVLRDRLANRSSAFVEVARKLPVALQRRIETARIGGDALAFVRDERRAYPQGGVGSQVIGFAGTDNVGLGGAELSLEATLRARPGREVVIQDPEERTLRVVSRRPGVAGHDVRLTLDADIQATVERVAAATAEEWEARAATALVLDVRTGGILAMASAPGLPDGDYSRGTDEQRRLRALTDQYEPGSTFKVVAVGAALEEGLVQPTTTFTVGDTIRRYDRTVSEAKEHGRRQMTVAEIIRVSSNVGVIGVALNVLGERTFDRWVRKVGFGRPTGVDLPGEVPGFVRPFSNWSGTSVLTIPIGVGVAATPLQVAGLYAAIANGGVWQQPHIVEEVYGSAPDRRARRRLFSPRTAEQLGTMLAEVVRSGTGVAAQIPRYTVAGKTGTTQKIDPKTGQYCGEESCLYHSSFVGYVPASKPRAVILVMVDEPKGQYYGSVVAAPAFREISTNVLQVMGVPPDAPDTDRP